MIRMIAQLTLGILANAIGLIAAATILDNFTIDASSFIVAVLVFSLATVVLGPFIMKVAMKNASYLVGGISLVTTLVGLVITTLLTDGLSIQGPSTWVVATLIIWIFSIIGNLLLPLVIFKKTMEKAKSGSSSDS